jgi:hypothetical protein
MLGGLLVWAAHFFAVYAAASLFPGDPRGNVVALAATLAALGANIALLRWALASRRSAGDGLDRWTSRLGAGAAALSLIAVIWQGLPALTFPQ